MGEPGSGFAFLEHTADVGIRQEERLWAALPDFILAHRREIEGLADA